jgi:hypothetical protein
LNPILIEGMSQKRIRKFSKVRLEGPCNGMRISDSIRQVVDSCFKATLESLDFRCRSRNSEESFLLQVSKKKGDTRLYHNGDASSTMIQVIFERDSKQLLVE